MTGRLGVYIAGVRAGVLDRDARGGETFAYEPGYAGVPLSLPMPLSAETYGRAAVRPFLFGLLPDSRETRRELGRRHGVSGENPLALLEHIGLDCPGAVQVCPDESPELLERTDSLVALSESDVAMRLRDLNRSDDASWILDDEHWSLGGTQGKFAIRLRGDAWFRCEGSAATTHIVKPGITRLKYQALDEYASMRLARVVGLPAASVAYRNFEDEPAIVVARFDRRELPDGSVVRIHQEDMCQALSVMPDHKYTFEGGPAAADILALLGKADPTGRSVRSFVLMLFFNYLIGASDAHAKNYSVLLGPDGAVALAPLYDVASILPYENSSRIEARAAMGIGGENRFGRVGGGAVRRFARQNGLDEALCLDAMGNLADRILLNLDLVRDDVSLLQGGEELGERLFPAVARLCDATLAQL